MIHRTTEPPPHHPLQQTDLKKLQRQQAVFLTQNLGRLLLYVCFQKTRQRELDASIHSPRPRPRPDGPREEEAPLPAMSTGKTPRPVLSTTPDLMSACTCLLFQGVP